MYIYMIYYKPDISFHNILYRIHTSILSWKLGYKKQKVTRLHNEVVAAGLRSPHLTTLLSSNISNFLSSNVRERYIFPLIEGQFWPSPQPNWTVWGDHVPRAIKQGNDPVIDGGSVCPSLMKPRRLNGAMMGWCGIYIYSSNDVRI